MRFLRSRADKLLPFRAAPAVKNGTQTSQGNRVLLLPGFRHGKRGESGTYHFHSSPSSHWIRTHCAGNCAVSPRKLFYVPRYFPLPFVFRVKARRNTCGNLCFFVAFYSRNPHGLARCTQQATMPPTSSFIAARVGAPPQDKPQQGIYAESVRFRRLPFHLQFSAARFSRTFPPSPVS